MNNSRNEDNRPTEFHSDGSQAMNISAFEQQLRALSPATGHVGEAGTMYACGYRAGIMASQTQRLSTATAIELTPASSTSQSRKQWKSLALAVSISCLITGPASYYLGQQSQSFGQSQTQLAIRNNSQQEVEVIDKQHSTDVPKRTEEMTVRHEDSRTPHQPNDKENVRFPEHILVAEHDSTHSVLTTAVVVFFGINQIEQPYALSHRQYLTSRSAVNWEARTEWPVIDGTGDSKTSGTNNSKQNAEPANSNPQAIRYIESLRNLSSEKSHPENLPWLN